MKNSTITLALISGLLIVVAGWWLSHDAPTRPKVIGVIQFTANNLTTLEGFKQGMQELGYVEGDNITYLFEGPTNNREALDQVMGRLLAQQPDLIFASPTPAAAAAKRATAGTNIPVIFAPANDPIAAQLVESIQLPGANLTGVRLAPSDGKRLEELLKLSPAVTRVVVPYNPQDKSALASLQQLQEVVPRLHIELLPLPFGPGDSVATTVAPLADSVGAIFLPRDGLVMSKAKEFVALCRQHRLLLSTPRLNQVEDGVLMGYGFIGFEIGKQASRLAHRVLQGEPPATLPIESSTDYLFINMRSAADIGLEIADSLLRRAHRIIYE